MDPFITRVVWALSLVASVATETCYEYKNSNTRAFDCPDGCCGSSTDAYCCMSPILIVGIVVGCLAGIIIIGVIVFICYQKYKQRKLNQIQKISIDQLSGNPTPRKSKKELKKQSKGGTMTTTHGDYYNKPKHIGQDEDNFNNNYSNNNTQHYNNNFKNPNPTYPQSAARTGTWLLNTNNMTAKQEMNGQLPPPPPPIPAISLVQPQPQTTNPNVMGPLGANVNSTAAVFNIPAPPGAVDLYADTNPIRPLPGSLPPLPPLQPKKC